MKEKEKEILLSSLAYFKMKIENYPYPSYEFKRGKLTEIDSLIDKVRLINTNK